MRGRGRRRAGGNTAPLKAGPKTDLTTGLAQSVPLPRSLPIDGPAGSTPGPRSHTACVHLPAFALQLFARRDSAVREGPAVVVDRDHPRGTVLQANEAARRERVLPGQRYAAALSLCPGLLATEVPPEEIAAGVSEVVGLLRRASPEVEAARPAARGARGGDLGEPGVFWLDATGLLRLHPTLLTWAERVERLLAAEGFTAAVVVGTSRFGSYALARALANGHPTQRVALFATHAEERAAARGVPLARLAIDPGLRDALDRLGVRTVGAFLDLPREGLARRFGKDAERLYLTARGELAQPLTPLPPVEPPVRRATFDMPETDLQRLLAVLERDLPGLLAETAARRQAVAALFVRLLMEDGPPRRLEVRPAAPTLEIRQILDLLGLQLEALVRDGLLPGRKGAHGVTELVLTVRGITARPEQLRLFRENPRRDLAVAARALARVRAELGPHSVVCARLRDGHLPEATFSWEPLDEVVLPRLAYRADTRPAGLVRRVLSRPRPLAPRPRHEPDGWLLAGLSCGPVRRQVGPYVLSGGWWAGDPAVRDEVHRTYHFTETARGDLLWVFHDRRRRRWFLQGGVE